MRNSFLSRFWKNIVLATRHFAFLLSSMGLLLFAYSLIRLLFYFFNLDFFQNIAPYEIFRAFLLGIRFDFTVLAQINFLFILLLSLPTFISHARWMQVFLKILFVFSNISFVFLSLLNIHLFPFQRLHLDKAIFHIIGDLPQQWDKFLFAYWWFSLSLLFIAYGLTKFYSYSFRFFSLKIQRGTSLSLPEQLVSFLFVFLLLPFALRGGFQSKNLNLAHAQNLGSYRTSLLILNAPFSFLSSFTQAPLEEKNYFQNQKKIQNYLASSQECQTVPPFPKPPRNLFIIIMESFGAEFLSLWKSGKNPYTPSIDSLVKEGGALFANAYANGWRSIHSLPPILASLPNWMFSPLVKTAYFHRQYPALGQILKKRGYRTLFLHGGTTGTMYFNFTAPALGLVEYHAYEEYVKYAKKKKIPKEVYDEEFWGIFDEAFFQYTIDTINEDTRRAFFAVLFSLTSHHPFTVPKEYADRFPIPKGENPFYRSIRYADHALGSFFKEVKKQSWAKDTLFVITADHTLPTNNVWNKNFLSRRRIPILFYQPGRRLDFMRTEYLAQQLDIFPTVLDFFNIKNSKKRLPFGSSLLAHCKERHVVLFEKPNYWFIKNRKVLLSSNNLKDAALFHFDGKDMGAPHKSYPPLELKEVGKKGAFLGKKERKRMQKQLRAYVQYYNNGLLYDKLLLEK